MRRIHRRAALAAIACLLAACGKPPASNDAPLAFVPADTPYAYANLEPVPSAITEQWSKPMQDYWPTLFETYESMLQDAKLALDDHTRQIAVALLDELKTHGSWDKLRAIGLKPDARVALYGVGIVPVLRLELGDPAAFKAEVARVEQKAGAAMPVAKTGDQEYWQVGNDTVAAAIAIEGTHLVVTLLPPKASDSLKQTLLGLKRPTQSLAAAGTLDTLAKDKGFSPYGEGFIDFVRVAERLSKPLEGSDAEFAHTLGLPAMANDETCRREYLDIAHKFPRLTIGAEEMASQRMRIATQLEIESSLARQIAAALGAAPGSGDVNVGAVDFSIALPVLKLKDFWIAQAAAVAAKPYACASLAHLNDAFAESQAKVDVTVPPPLSDLTGFRLALTRFALKRSADSVPDVSGKLLLATTNPMAALAMAQLAVPALQKLKITTDGKPVALPADALPFALPPISAAMSDKAIALATGADDVAALGAFLAAPGAATPVFARVHFSGAVYGWLAHSFETMKTALPADGQKRLEQQAQLFGIYEKWLRSSEFTLSAMPNGIVMRQTIELTTPQVSP
jgi:hypothetical protein